MTNPPVPSSIGLVVGAYAAAPTGAASEDRATYHRALAADARIGALEVPWTPDLVDAEHLPERGAGVGIVLTVLPTTMVRRKEDPRYGLAATDPSGRAQAMADLRQVRDLVARLNATGQVVHAVEVHSSPRPADGAAVALADALGEVCGWDWNGAAVLVEHCDTVVAGHPSEKGFLTIEDELAAVAQARSTGTTATGLVVNWGRSALEGRNPGTARDHIALAAARGLLAGMVFSGVARDETSAGPAWADLHLAPAPVAAASLMDLEAMRQCRAAAGDDFDGFVGLKVGFGLEARPLADRIALVLDSVDVASRVAPARTRAR